MAIDIGPMVPEAPEMRRAERLPLYDTVVEATAALPVSTPGSETTSADLEDRSRPPT